MPGSTGPDSPHHHEVIAEPDSGHFISLLVPFQPMPGYPQQGADDQIALARVWPQVLDFLAVKGQG